MLESSFSWKNADFLGLSLPSIVSSLEEMVHRNARIGGKSRLFGPLANENCFIIGRNGTDKVPLSPALLQFSMLIGL